MYYWFGGKTNVMKILEIFDNFLFNEISDELIFILMKYYFYQVNENWQKSWNLCLIFIAKIKIQQYILVNE